MCVVCTVNEIHLYCLSPSNSFNSENFSIAILKWNSWPFLIAPVIPLSWCFWLNEYENTQHRFYLATDVVATFSTYPLTHTNTHMLAHKKSCFMNTNEPNRSKHATNNFYIMVSVIDAYTHSHRSYLSIYICYLCPTNIYHRSVQAGIKKAIEKQRETEILSFNNNSNCLCSGVFCWYLVYYFSHWNIQRYARANPKHNAENRQCCKKKLAEWLNGWCWFLCDAFQWQGKRFHNRNGY